MESLEFGVVQFSWFSWVALHQFASSTKTKFEREVIFSETENRRNPEFSFSQISKKKKKKNSQKCPPTNYNDFTEPRSMTSTQDVSHQPKGTKHSIYISHYRLVGQKQQQLSVLLKYKYTFK